MIDLRIPGLFLLVLVALTALSGCETIEVKGSDVTDRPARPDVMDGGGDEATAGDWRDWPFAPKRAKWHSFTSMQMDAERGPFIDAHIELLDVQGASVKGVGVFRIELYRRSGRASEVTGDGRMIANWRVDIQTLEANAQFYDPIMRAYRFPLRVDAPLEDDESLRLVMHYVGHTGQRMEDTIQIKVERE